MPIFLTSALAMLVTTFGRKAVRTGLGAVAAGTGTALVLDDAGGLIPDVFGAFTGGDKPKRRRRRRALTASDRADIGFITGLLGPAAGKQFAVTIATRAS